MNVLTLGTQQLSLQKKVLKMDHNTLKNIFTCNFLFCLSCCDIYPFVSICPFLINGLSEISEMPR